MEIVRRILMEMLWLVVGLLGGLAAWWYLEGRPEVVEGNLRISLEDMYFEVENFTVKAGMLVALALAWFLFFLRSLVQVYRVWLTAFLLILLSTAIWWVLGEASDMQRLLCESMSGWEMYPGLEGISDEPPARFGGYGYECDQVRRLLDVANLLLFIVAIFTFVMAIARLVFARRR